MKQWNVLKNKIGFTLIELIVVISILGVLAALVTPRMSGYIEHARLSVDQATVRTLNGVTPVFRVFLENSDPFEDDSNDSDELMQKLVDAEYLSEIVKPQTNNADFLWNFQEQIWQIFINNSPIPLSPLGSSFEEISSGMISLIIQKYERTNSYGRTWGDYAYTDIGLDPNDWKDPILHVYYKPQGSNLRISPEDGFDFIVYDMSGNEKKLKYSYNWDLIYSDINKKWYYHSISVENEIDITTLEISN